MKKTVILKKDEFFIETIEKALSSNTAKTSYTYSKKEMVQILADVARVEDKELRLSLISKLGVS